MTSSISTRIALFFIAACALSTWATAQNNPKKSTPAGTNNVACPSAAQLKPVQLYGAWRVHFSQPPAGLPADATMQLERHAEFSESLAGSVSRELGAAAGNRAVAGHAPRAQLAGDLEDGFLTLDESSNGISITGTWNGEMVEGSCGKKFKGTWKDTSSSAPPDAADVPFTLERNPGW
ncbi:hypothetical protein [Polaromonas sp. UC242_47]|uniref:hypothetical protein n=1 Tax=Polaromonas sp. UC242_47 TaxID=3374626 RepID=UPI0037A1E9F3